VKIPLPDLLRKLREKQVERGLRPCADPLQVWAWVARRPALYALGTKIGVRYLKWLAGGKDRIRLLGVAPGWTQGRDFPAPQGETFRELYARGKRDRAR
jgi:L-lactate dehydrogenase complex protein LldF